MKPHTDERGSLSRPVTVFTPQDWARAVIAGAFLVALVVAWGFSHPYVVGFLVTVFAGIMWAIRYFKIDED